MEVERKIVEAEDDQFVLVVERRLTEEAENEVV